MTSVPDPQPDVVSLQVRHVQPVEAGRICDALRAPDWLGQPVEAGDAPPGTRRFLTDLVLPLPPDGRLLSLRKAALVDIGRPEPLAGGGCVAEIAWRSASLAPLFPVFAGRLVAAGGRLSLDGRYAPPGGVLGRAADRMLLHTAANGTARWFLGHLAAVAGAPTGSTEPDPC